MPRLRCAAVLIAVAVGTGACTGDTPVAVPAPSVTAAPAAPSSPSSTDEPRTYEAAKSATEKIDAAAAAADGGTSWDMLTASGQAAMSRDDYAKVVANCPALLAGNVTLSVAMDAGGSTATVTAAAPPAQGGQPYTWRLIYEGGHWRRQPSDGALNWMTLGADKALLVLRDGGYC